MTAGKTLRSKIPVAQKRKWLSCALVDNTGSIQRPLVLTKSKLRKRC